MNTTLMLNSHQTADTSGVGAAAADSTPWSWDLPARQARTLPASAQPRWLQVASGCVWLTRADGSEQAQDIWLLAGQSLALPAGSAWVLEGWPQARLSLLLQAPEADATFRRGRGAAQRSSGRRSWWRSLAS
jgi:Protein of unknown function (DUF2917)